MKILTLVAFLLASFVSKSQTELTPLDSSLTLAEYLEKNFYSQPVIDSCYTGIHYLLIMPQASGSVSLKITGNINVEYKKRVETLLAADIWNKKFISDCLKKKQLIVQPIFLDITKNCARTSLDLLQLASDSLSNISFEKEKVYEIATKLLVQQHLSLLESYKSFTIGTKTECIILSQCYITGRPTRKITM